MKADNDFHVDPDDLDEAARHIWRLAQENTRAISYVQEWLKVSESGGQWLAPALDGLQRACDQLRTNYERLGTVTDSSASELLSAADMYRSTDTETAAALDRTYSSKGSK